MSPVSDPYMPVWTLQLIWWKLTTAFIIVITLEVMSLRSFTAYFSTFAAIGACKPQLLDGHQTQTMPVH